MKHDYEEFLYKLEICLHNHDGAKIKGYYNNEDVDNLNHSYIQVVKFLNNEIIRHALRMMQKLENPSLEMIEEGGHLMCSASEHVLEAMVKQAEREVNDEPAW